MRFLTIICWIVSLLLHCAVGVVGIWVLQTEVPLRLLDRDIYEVELVALAPPQQESQQPVKVASPATATAKPSPQKSVSASAPPKPAPAPQVKHSPAPPPVSPKRPPRTSPLPQSAATASQSVTPPTPISSRPSKRPQDTPPESPPAPEEPELPGAYTDEEGTIHVGGLYGFAGFADTFALEQCGADTFTPDDYFGHYHMGGPRFVSIIDGRESFGRFLFYDSKSGMFRALRRDANMVFAYGYGFEPEEPVEGVVTILPKKDRYNDPLIKKPAQLMWMPDTPPMEYGTRISFDEKAVSFMSGDVRLTGVVVTRPRIAITAAVVLIHCEHCQPQKNALAMARILSLHGISVLVYDGRGCGESDVVTGPLTFGHQVADAAAAYAFLRHETGLPDGNVGFWGDSGGVRLALRAAEAAKAPFVVCSQAARGPVRQRGVPEIPEGGTVPRSLWLLAATEPERYWREHVRAITAGWRGTDVRLLRIGTDAGGEPNPHDLLPLPLRYGDAFSGWFSTQ